MTIRIALTPRKKLGKDPLAKYKVHEEHGTSEDGTPYRMRTYAVTMPFGKLPRKRTGRR